MGCHTWSYRRLKDSKILENVLIESIESTKNFINIVRTDPSYTEKFAYEQDVNTDNYNAYLEDCKKGLCEYDEDLVSYVDDTDQRIFYHEETIEQMIHRYDDQNILIQSILDELRLYDDGDAIMYFKNVWDDIFNIMSYEQYHLVLHNDIIYYSEWGNDTDGMYRQLNNPFNEFDPSIFFRVYGYPFDNDPEFYEESPLGYNPVGFTDAENMIEFLEWYRTIDDTVPYTIDKNGECVDGYTELLYDNIRTFFNHFEKDEVFVEFS